MSTSGYSGTPLAKKLGIKEGFSIQVFNPPKPYRTFFEDLPKDIDVHKDASANIPMDFIHIFVAHPEELESLFSLAKHNLKKDGMLWISWPKKTSQIVTTLDKFAIMNYGQKKGLVDIKVAAIDADWSGHKFVYRVKDR
ncbi:DUF3052 domain-containing protein [Maribacter sp. 2210JD10-5]|uniref:DUF3052 domain-containing protein n=1 Tax=Maribacter sp. 2210JD10-5 TaxID=3386272 RepID=UPI0039BD514E